MIWSTLERGQDPEHPPRQRRSFAAGIESTPFSKRYTKTLLTRQWEGLQHTCVVMWYDTRHETDLPTHERTQERRYVWMRVVLNYLCFLS